jgi:phospholipid transport system transporter-binding protein
VLIAPNSITHATASASLDALRQSLMNESASEVILDASGLSHFDSAALAVLLGVRREALKLGKTFAIKAMPQRLADLARLYGISELLPVQP